MSPTQSCVCLLATVLSGCATAPAVPPPQPPLPTIEGELPAALVRVEPPPETDGFDFPVGPPDAEGYYDAQPFGVRTHLGSDWNGVGGGDTDLGLPVHAVANGVVTQVYEFGGGWCRVVRVAHPLPDGLTVESLYAHLDRSDVVLGDHVRRGQSIGTIGDCDGQYAAHLHFELRAAQALPLGGGYGESEHHLDPTAWILSHRPD